MPGPAWEIEDVLAACLDDLAAGATSAQCLERYAAYADEIRPLLTVSGQLYERWPAMSAGARARGRERMHRALDERPARFFGWLPLREQVVALVLIIASLIAAWLAWPGFDQNKVSPASATKQPVATPSSSPSPVMPTASPSQAVVAPMPTQAAPTSAVRTATPDLTATPTPELRATATPAVVRDAFVPGSPAEPESDDQPPGVTPTAAVQPTRTATVGGGRPGPVTTPRPMATPEDGRAQPEPKSRAKDHPAPAKANGWATPKSHAAGSKRTEEPKNAPDPATPEPPQRVPRPATTNPPAAAPEPAGQPPAPPATAAPGPPPGVQAPATAEPKARPTAGGDGPPSAPPHPKQHATPERPAHPNPTASRAQKG